jgi:hypothetical protein
LNCPACGNAIEADFGVVTCGRCQTVLFVDMDGNIQVSVASGSESPMEVPIVESPNFDQVLDGAPMDFPDVMQSPGTTPTQEGLSNFDSLTVALPDQSPRSLAQEVDEFANSENGTMGALSYWVKIEGIDTKELRTQVERVFADPKLMLDWSELLEAMVGGVIEIKQVNPVKASRLVQKLNDLPVKVSWRQSVYDN